jgi:hypothetical protein
VLALKYGGWQARRFLRFLRLKALRAFVSFHQGIRRFLEGEIQIDFDIRPAAAGYKAVGASRLLKTLAVPRK